MGQGYIMEKCVTTRLEISMSKLGLVTGSLNGTMQGFKIMGGGGDGAGMTRFTFAAKLTPILKTSRERKDFQNHDSNPTSNSNRLCDPGQVTQTLQVCFLICKLKGCI